MLIDARMRDILLAGAIGDAVGYVVEFNKLRQIHKLYGPNGLTLDMIHPLAQLVVSDDTQMTLFALEALHYGTNKAHFQKAFKDWYYTQTEGPYSTSLLASFGSMRHQRAPGSTCLGALNRGQPYPDSKGCGAVMRAAPLGFLDNFEDAFMLGDMQGAITHGHPSGHLPGGVLAGLIHLSLYQPALSLDEKIDVVVKMYLKEEIDHKETLDAIWLAQDIFNKSTGDTYSDIRRLGEGWVGEEALSIALYAVYAAKSFEEVIQISINHDGDSDSTGAIAAQLWAAHYGLPEAYRSWESRLDIANAFAYVTNENNYK